MISGPMMKMPPESTKITCWSITGTGTTQALVAGGTCPKGMKMALTKEQRIEIIEKDKKIRNRVHGLMYEAAKTLDIEFGIGYSDAEDELIRWGRLKAEEDY